MRRVGGMTVVWSAMALSGWTGAAAQSGAVVGDSLSNAGVKRASAASDSVFVDHLKSQTVINGGDFASYLMARLGVVPIPADLAFRVSVDTQHILMFGKVEDLPWLTRRALASFLAMFPPSSRVVAQITLHESGPQAVRFHLRAVWVNDQPVPEPLLIVVMGNVGAQYKALTSTGRDLFVAIPPGGRVVLEAGRVRLVGPAKE